MNFKKKILFNQKIKDTYNSLKELNLNTIYVEGNCPNIGECFSKGKMTFLILGDICTRNCLYKRFSYNQYRNTNSITNYKRRDSRYS